MKTSQALGDPHLGTWKSGQLVLSPSQRCPICFSNNRNHCVKPQSLVCVCVCVCFPAGVVRDPGLAAHLSAVIGGVACFSGPLIQYDHFTAPGGKSRCSVSVCTVQHTRWRTHVLSSTGLQGTYRMRWAVGVGPRCRNQAQVLAPDQSTPLWAQAPRTALPSRGNPVASPASLRGKEASIDFTLWSDRPLFFSPSTPRLLAMRSRARERPNPSCSPRKIATAADVNSPLSHSLRRPTLRRRRRRRR